MTDNIPKEEWLIKKNKSKKVNLQKIESSDNEKADTVDSNEKGTTGDVEVLHSGSHTLSWSGSHSRPKGSVSSYEKHDPKVKFTGVHGVSKQPKIKVNRQMDDVISLGSACQATVLK